MANRSKRSRPQRSRHNPEARARAAAAIVAEHRLIFPESLPITERHDELLAAINEHQVVIVAGETGSGKSTQIPKLCLEAGRGIDGMIGHTQPRRVAARTIAERIADELGSKLGADVGYTVRFTDQVAEGTLIKVMTDGILLAEIQRDRMLSRYDTLIIDEAHERSLNIDFILGYVKQLLPQRPDLKVIVTSATIDTARFAHHFAAPPADDPHGASVDAMVIEVTGRTFPVEMRYRPFGANNPSGDPETGVGQDKRDQVQAIIDAVQELEDAGPGDVLVFLSGEREIHDTADALRRLELRNTDVLPLYARLSSVEQHRIFEAPKKGSLARRVVLATNIAETSLTVPGVRFVVDAGSARISRYSRRLKVQQLPIEPVSQASANQRAGRCGRVAAGVCIRLYAEEDFDTRPEFTEPEILRTNLASVILQMTAIGLGDVAGFPFVEPPDRAAIRDGYLLLEELAAIELTDRAESDSASDSGERGRTLTKIGRRLARLPIDPRLGRMVLEAERHDCVREVMVIASVLSIQDPRERPDDKREKANEFHNRFKVEGSDLLTLVELWDYLRRKQRELSGNQFRRMCRSEFLNYLRVREWMDLYSQLRRIAGDLGLRPHNDESHPDHVHKAILAGLLSHLGMRDRDSRDFIGARDARFVIAPGSVMTRRPPPWIMAAELVETNRLYARQVAAIQPQWAEKVGAHAVKRSYGDIRWDSKGGRAVATENVTLYGLPLVSDRVVGYDRVDAAEARAWFITKALVEGDVADEGWAGRHRFIQHNGEVLERIGRMASRARRLEVVDDEMLFEFFDDHVGDDVTSTRHFDRWWKGVRRDEPTLLDLDTQRDLLDRYLVDYPDIWRQPHRSGAGEIELPLTYRYAPGEPLDGVTTHLPLAGLNQVTDSGFDWQVPGHRDELVAALVKSLPKQIRRQLIPLAETIAAVTENLDSRDAPDGRLTDALAEALTVVSGIDVSSQSFNRSAVPDYIRMNFVVSDDEGTVHGVGTDLDALKASLAGSARQSVAAAAPIDERRGISTWDLGDLPQVVESTDRAMDVRAYPALLDVGESVSLRVVTTPDLQHRVMHGGVRRLLILTAAPTRKSIERILSNDDRLAIANGSIPLEVLADDCIAAAVDAEMREHGSLPWNEADFEELRRIIKQSVPGVASNAMAKAAKVVRSAALTSVALLQLFADALRPSVVDANAHLGRLVRPGFVLSAGVQRLDDIDRYVRSINYRLEHLAGATDRDRRRMAEVAVLEQRYNSLVDARGSAEISLELVDVGWMLEEFRVATFAQPLMVKRSGAASVSAKRINAALDSLCR
jgi:ATP-dependent helicase HrpA